MTPATTAVFSLPGSRFWAFGATQPWLHFVQRIPRVEQLLASMPGNEKGRDTKADFQEFFFYAPSKSQVPKYPGMLGGATIIKSRVKSRMHAAATEGVGEEDCRLV